MGNTRSIFSALRCGFSYLDSVKLTEDIKVRINTLNALKDFVYSGCYTSYKNKVVFLENEDLKDTELAHLLGISVAGVRQARKRISEDAYSKLGYNVVDSVLYGTRKACDSVINSITVLSYIHSTRDYMFNDVLDCISNSYIGEEVESFKLNECRNEMLFLRLYTLQNFYEFVSMLDLSKLNYIVSLLRADSDSTGDKLLALKYILKKDGDMSFLIKEFKSKAYGKRVVEMENNSKEE